MKQVIGAITAGVLALGILGAAGAARADDKVILGVAIPTADHGFTGGIDWWANKAKEDMEKAHPDLKVILKTSASAPEQANQLQDMVTVNKINALVIFPHESASLTQPVAQVKKKGIYVTVVDCGLTDTSAQDAYVAGDNTAFGRLAGEYFCKTLDGHGDIVALRGIPTTLDNERYSAFTEALKACPGVKVLDAKYANWNRDDAFKVMQDYLTRFKHIDAVWSADDDMSVGVLKAIDQAKRTDIKEVLGGAGSKEMIKRVLDGDKIINADVTYSPKFIYDAIKLTAEARLKGQTLPPKTIIPSVLVTKDNAKDYYFPDSPF
jgi:ribose transport system substrate-binding protein